MAGELFDMGSDDSDRKLDKPKLQGGTPRLRAPQRDQVEMHFWARDEMLDSNQPFPGRSGRPCWPWTWDSGWARSRR
jgi:hypothetical protein